MFMHCHTASEIPFELLALCYEGDHYVTCPHDTVCPSGHYKITGNMYLYQKREQKFKQAKSWFIKLIRDNE